MSIGCNNYGGKCRSRGKKFCFVPKKITAHHSNLALQPVHAGKYGRNVVNCGSVFFFTHKKSDVLLIFGQSATVRLDSCELVSLMKTLLPKTLVFFVVVFRAELEKHGHKVDQPEPMKT